MRVTMRQQISGTRNGDNWPAPGESLDVTDSEAADLVRLGLAAEPDGTQPARRGKPKPETPEGNSAAPETR